MDGQVSFCPFETPMRIVEPKVRKGSSLYVPHNSTKRIALSRKFVAGKVCPPRREAASPTFRRLRVCFTLLAVIEYETVWRRHTLSFACGRRRLVHCKSCPINR